MKINNYFKFQILILLHTIIFSITCNQSTEPDQEIKLILENGLYQKIGTSQDEIKYSIEFYYYVEGSKCKIGGYNIQWDEDHIGQVDWYVMKTIFPGHKYYISDTMSFSNPLTSDPIVTMQGYLENKTEIDSRLRSQLILKRK